MRGSPVSEIAKQFALNWVSLGGELRSFSGDDVKAQFVSAGWPSAESFEYFGLSGEEFNHGLGAATIAEFLGLKFEWNRVGDEVTFTFSRPGAD